MSERGSYCCTAHRTGLRGGAAGSRTGGVTRGRTVRIGGRSLGVTAGAGIVIRRGCRTSRGSGKLTLILLRKIMSERRTVRISGCTLGITTRASIIIFRRCGTGCRRSKLALILLGITVTESRGYRCSAHRTGLRDGAGGSGTGSMSCRIDRDRL